ncbi:conserved oligomeric Golgi complex subunit 4 isoform X2 [Hyalella azteca]|uniref:Conserved oligomeric Golgi complex subunit 4 n=1 Tax=Hyalella azteca TaxID=294128 RepID=A0A8B7NK43_HYAAZ|nr:conserved oligomeric Golgi complex subunit 4 isoform X2 [Hyalella azteca]
MATSSLDSAVTISALTSNYPIDKNSANGELLSPLDFDFDNLTSLKDIEDAYNKLCIEEKRIDERLDWSVANRHQLEARLAQVSKLLPSLQVVYNDACQLQNTIASTQQLATAVSARVRKLDTAKQSVVEVQRRVADLLDLEGCAGGVATALVSEDYETAAAHIHRFLAMDETLLLHSAAANSTGSGSIETWFEKLREAETQLSALIERRFDEAVTSQDSASVDRFFKLFPLLNRKQQGLLKFSAFLCEKIQETGEAVLTRCRSCSSNNKRAHVMWADAATELFETVARIIEVRQPIIETYYGPGQLAVVVQELVRETDRQAGRLIAEMRAHRRLDALTTAVSESLSNNGPMYNTSSSGGPGGSGDSYSSAPALLDPRSLDTLLGELTLLNARADLFLRFMKRRVAADLEASIVDPDDLNRQLTDVERKMNRCQVACDMAAVLGQYTILEQYYLNQSFAKALSMDTTITASSDSSSVGDAGDQNCAPVSSIVDDAFFIIKKSVRRAIASSSPDGVCAVLNHAVTLLETQLAAGFQHTLRRGFPAQGYYDIAQAYSAIQSSLQTGKLQGSSADSEQLRQTFLTALNSAETSQRHVGSLESALQEAVSSNMTSLSSNSTDKIQSCFGDLRNCGVRLQAVTELGLNQLRATAVKPRVKSWMAAFTGASYDITEEEFSGYEAHDPFSSTLIMNVW